MNFKPNVIKYVIDIVTFCGKKDRIGNKNKIPKKI